MPEIVFGQAPASLPHNSVGQHGKVGLIPVCCVKKAQTLVLLLQCVHCQHVSVPVQSRRRSGKHPAYSLPGAHSTAALFRHYIIYVIHLVVCLNNKAGCASNGRSSQLMSFLWACMQRRILYSLLRWHNQRMGHSLTCTAL